VHVLGKVTISEAVLPAPTVPGDTVTPPASYLVPICSSQPPLTEARVITTATDLIVTTPEVPSCTPMVAWSVYARSLAEVGQTYDASTDALFNVKVDGPPIEQPPVIATTTRRGATLASRETSPILLYKLLAMGHLDSQRSLPVFGENKSGFSSMAKKLRLAAGQKVAVLNAPDGYAARLSPGPADIGTRLQAAQAYDVVQLFVNSTDELRRLGPEAIRAVKPDGLLWITYPKGGQTSGVSDLPATPWWTKRDVLGEITSVTGYKPVAFVAIDDHYTALRFKRA
jgi:hypothetical protein